MKSKIKYYTLSIIGTFLTITVFCFIAFLPSCGGLGNANQISAKNIITNDDLLIKIKVKQSPVLGNWTHFAIEKDLSVLSDELMKKSNIDSTKIYNNEFILVESENMSPFLIKEIEKLDIDGEEDYRYAFFAPTARFDYQDIVFPYHLFDDVQIQYYPGFDGICFKESQKFSTDYDIKEIYEFYNGIVDYSANMSSQNVVTVSDDLSNKIFTVTYNPESKNVSFNFSNI